MIQFIMLLTKGPVHAEHAIEFTDWNKVVAFGKKIAELKKNKAA